jgi:hypothetical protein
MKKFYTSTYNLLYLMLFSPLLSYFTKNVFGLNSITNYFVYYVIFYGIIFFLYSYKIIAIPNMIYLIIIYSIYQSIWAFFNGELGGRGLLQILIRKENLSIIFIIIIIYNTKFSDKFINNSIKIIKYTTIIATLVTLIQIVNFDFMNPTHVWNYYGLEHGSIYTYRRTSIFGFVSLNEVGLSFVPLLAVLIGYMVKLKNKDYRLYIFLGAIICIFSNARYIIMGFSCIIFLVIIENRFHLSKIVTSIIFFSLLSILLYQILVLFDYNIYQWLDERIFVEKSFEETTRYKGYLNFLYFFPEKPIFGVGVHITDEIKMASNAIGSSQIHVGYLAHLVSYGIIGSIFLFGFWSAICKKFYNTAKLTNYWGSFIGFTTFLLSQATLVYYEIFFYGIIFCFVFDKYMNDRSQYIKTRLV